MSQESEPEDNGDSISDKKAAEMRQRAADFLSNLLIKPMPFVREDVRNGTLISAQRDMPEIGIKHGAMFPVIYDGTHIRGGDLQGPSWGVEQLREEFEKGWWEVRGQLDEWAGQRNTTIQ